MKDKYLPWGIVGLGVAVFLWYLTKKQIDTQNVSVPYQVPVPLAPQGNGNPSSTPTISEQPNIIGDHPNSTIPNGSNPTFPDMQIWRGPLIPTTPPHFNEQAPTQPHGQPIQYRSPYPQMIRNPNQPYTVGGVDPTNPRTWMFG